MDRDHGLKYQTPTTKKGVSLSREVLDKLESMWENLPSFEFFPPAVVFQFQFILRW
jgi:hypothetical protein